MHPCRMQTGKSYTLEHLVPAVMAEALRKHQPAAQPAQPAVQPAAQQAAQQAEQPAEQPTEDGGRGAPRLADMVVLRLKGDQLTRSVRLLWRAGVCRHDGRMHAVCACTAARALLLLRPAVCAVSFVCAVSAAMSALL